MNSDRTFARNSMTILVLLALAGIAYLGHAIDWRLDMFWRSSGLPDANPRPSVTVEVVQAIQKTNSPTEAGTSQSQRETSVPLGNILPSHVLPSHVLPSHVLRFNSAEEVEKLGIDVAPVWNAPMTDFISASAETMFHPAHVAHLTSRSQGVAWRVLKRLGQQVQVDEVLALIELPEVGKAKTDLLQAVVHFRAKVRAYENASQAPIREQQRQEAHAALRDAESRVVSAEQSLLNLGLGIAVSELAQLEIDEMARRIHRLGLPTEFSGLADEQIPGTLWPLVSPLAGFVTTCDIIAGEAVPPARTLYTIADRNRLSLVLHVGAKESPRVALGQLVHFRPDGMSRETVGQVNWVSAAANERTRTVSVRADLDNSDGRLWAKLNGIGKIIVREDPRATVVPNESLQFIGAVRMLFVRDPEYHAANQAKKFEVRNVHCGAKNEQFTEILAGVRPGEIVVTKGSAFLLNELKRFLNETQATSLVKPAQSKSTPSPKTTSLKLLAPPRGKAGEQYV